MPRKRPTYADDLKQRLRDQAYAADYLNAAMGDDEEVFLLALRDVVDAHRVSRVARETGLNRETLYRTLSERGNPTLRTLAAVLDAVGFELSVLPKGASAAGHEEAAKDDQHTTCEFAATVPLRRR